MSLYYDRAEIRIDLDALLYNLEQMKKNLPEETGIMAVVKTDAYGHGAYPIATCLETVPYISGFGVATVEEGISLRREGVQKPILVLGATFPKEIRKGNNLEKMFREGNFGEPLKRPERGRRKKTAAE